MPYYQPRKRDHPLYAIWNSMIQRCYCQKRKDYPRYGGRGITVCRRWVDNFGHFIGDMGPRPEGYTLERIDVNGNYEPSNCKWATMEEQTHNQRLWRSNKSGQRGVSFNNLQQKWKGTLYSKGTRYHLGYYTEKCDAIQARKFAEALYW